MVCLSKNGIDAVGEKEGAVVDGIKIGCITVGEVVGREVSPGIVGLNDGAMVGSVDGVLDGT